MNGRNEASDMRKLPRLVISAAHKSSGKTVTTVGICAALADSGLKVQSFKKGPDYIDPGWLSTASGRECHNLDKFMIGWDNIDSVFKRHARLADISIVEGNKGLYDSIELDGEGSTANLARRLKAPVVLVIDSSKITRGIAPLLIGYKSFEPDINIAGVILNKVSNKRHEKKLRAVIEEFCDIEVLGVIYKSKEMEVLERHLGLIPAKEDLGLYPAISQISNMIKSSINLERLKEIAESAEPLEVNAIEEKVSVEPKVKIGVVRDHAFTFYYPENLEALRLAGAGLVPVNTLKDEQLPYGLDALYIGGGFPENFVDQLTGNTQLREDIKLAVENGLPVYAECGGLIYLAKSVSWKGKKSDMVGALDCDIAIGEKPKGHGYIKLVPTGSSPWFKGDEEINAHEFHYGEVINSSHDEYAFKVLVGAGIDNKHDGILYKNVTASFAHLHHLGCPEWAGGFVDFAERIAYSKKVKTLSASSRDQIVKNKFLSK